MRKYLRKSGFRYRIHYPIYGKPDIVFPKKKIAIFIHGCFWHLHGCKNSVIPKTNKGFWDEKLGKNTQRDRLVLKNLKKERWRIKIIWECQIEKNFLKTTQKISNFIEANRRIP